MTSQVLNFLWLNLDFPASDDDPADGSIRAPMPAKYIDNLLAAGAANHDADVVFWVDSARLTKKQMKYLEGVIETDQSNVQLRDLRSIRTYAKEPLFNEGQVDSFWRDEYQNSPIWCQVDAAKALVSLQGKYDQVFFADFDHFDVKINADPIQKALRLHGMFFGKSKNVLVENQVWGFTPAQRGFFKQHYADAVKYGRRGENGWTALYLGMRPEIMTDRADGSNSMEEFCLEIPEDGSKATHPGHRWASGNGDEAEPAFIPRERLRAVFDARRKKKSKVAVSTPAHRRQGREMRLA